MKSNYFIKVQLTIESHFGKTTTHSKRLPIQIMNREV